MNTEGIIPGGFNAETAIDAQLAELERWAVANLRRDRQQLVRFWLLKGAAFIGASVAAVAAVARRYARGDRVCHARCAVHGDRCGLALVVVSQRASASSAGPSRASEQRQTEVGQGSPGAPRIRPRRRRIAHASALLDHIQTKREEIGKYLGGAEANPDVGITPS